MYMEIDGYQICYKESGTGKETAVILQGWGTEMSLYDQMADCINEKFRVVQLDLPGFGVSDEPREAWAVSDYAAFFLKFLERLNIKKTTLIGHSYGGRIIIKLAGRNDLPVEIDRIVLVDSAGVLPKKTKKQKRSIKRYQLMKKLAAFPPVYFMFSEMIDDWKSRQGSEDYKKASPMMKQCLVKAVNEDLSGLFGDVKQEVLLIWGDQDTATPLADGQLMEQKMQNAALAVIRGAGHFCFAEKPEVFGGIIRSFLL